MTEQSFEEAKPTVVVASHRVPEALLSEIIAACERANVRRFLWTGENGTSGSPASQLVTWLSATGAPPPALLVAWLAAGERRVPDDIVDLMTRSMPTISLLLLCEEPLVRPSVTIQSGRVTLLSPPLTSGRIAARVRALTANAVSATGSLVGTGRGDTSSGAVKTRERQHANGWIGSVTSSDPAEGLPLVLQGVAEGLTALLRISGHAPSLGDSDASRVADTMRREEPDEAKERALRDMLGDNYGALHLAPDGEDWIFYWPGGPEIPLNILSPTRLPNAYNLSRALGRTGSLMMRVPAASGDVVVALSTTSGAEDEIAGALGEGGPAILDVLTGKLRDGSRRVSGVIAEVR